MSCGFMWDCAAREDMTTGKLEESQGLRVSGVTAGWRYSKRRRTERRTTQGDTVRHMVIWVKMKELPDIYMITHAKKTTLLSSLCFALMNNFVQHHDGVKYKCKFRNILPTNHMARNLFFLTKTKWNSRQDNFISAFHQTLLCAHPSAVLCKKKTHPY